MIRRISSAIILLVFSVSVAEADQLFLLTAHGTTPSTAIGNVGPNVDWTLKAYFHSTPEFTPETGTAWYRASDISATFNGTTVQDELAGEFVILGGPTNTAFPGDYIVTLAGTSPGTEPTLKARTPFTTTTPTLDPLNPSATVFSEYARATDGLFAMIYNNNKFYTFTYNSQGPSVTITAVPEPSSFALGSVAIAVLIIFAHRRSSANNGVIHPVFVRRND
jgi:hypothetical protein